MVHFFSVNPSLVSHLLYPIPPFYLLGDPSSFARGANIHPLTSLVSYQLSSPCCLTHPEGSPQIKLHIYIEDINNISRPVRQVFFKPVPVWMSNRVSTEKEEKWLTYTNKESDVKCNLCLYIMECNALCKKKNDIWCIPCQHLLDCFVFSSIL
jgi:hypothetical protein